MVDNPTSTAQTQIDLPEQTFGRAPLPTAAKVVVVAAALATPTIHWLGALAEEKLRLIDFWSQLVSWLPYALSGCVFVLGVHAYVKWHKASLVLNRDGISWRQSQKVLPFSEVQAITWVETWGMVDLIITCTRRNNRLIRFLFSLEQRRVHIALWPFGERLIQRGIARDTANYFATVSTRAKSDVVQS